MRKLLHTLLWLTLTLFSVALALIWIGGGLGSKKHNSSIPVTIDFAHRGCCTNLPRNCIAAFERATQQGLAIETDLRITKDDVLVLFHDDTTNLKLGIDGQISDFTITEIKKHPFIHDNQETKFTIVSLGGYLINNPNTVTYLDIKTPTKRLADRLVEKLDSNNLSNAIVADANIIFLAYLKWRNPKILTAWEGFDSGKEWTYSLIPRDFKPNYLASFRNKVTQKHIEWLITTDLLKSKIVYGEKSDNDTLIDQIPYHIIECD